MGQPLATGRGEATLDPLMGRPVQAAAFRWALAQARAHRRFVAARSCRYALDRESPGPGPSGKSARSTSH